jgi:hypothetical protein
MPYQLLGSESTVQVLSPDFARDAQRYTAIAEPSGVVFSLLFAPFEIWSPAAIASQLNLWADRWNANRLVPGVLGIQVTQETDEAGQLKDVAIVTVGSTSGVSTATAVIPETEWNPDVTGTTLTTSFGDAIRAVVARLDAVEAG